MLLGRTQHLHLLTNLSGRIRSVRHQAMRTLFRATLGFCFATIVAWGGLMAWGFVFLRRDDSYWDRVGGADTFFVCWLLFSIGAAVAAVRLQRTRH